MPSIRCYGGSSGGLFINNKVNNDISNISSNDDYGTINVTDDDITWGNTTTIKLLGKIRDSAGNLGTDGQVLTADASGFTVWETPAAGSGLSGSGTTNRITKWTGTSSLGNSNITDDGENISVGLANGDVSINVGSAGSYGVYLKRNNTTEATLNTAVYNSIYNGTLLGHNLDQALGHINTTLNAYYMDLGGRGSSGIGGTSSGIFFGMKAASTSTETNLLTLDENGNVGIGGVTAPAQKLHVSGTARITGSDGTATTITGRDGDGDISNVSIGYGLNLVGGTLEVDTTEVATQGDLAALGGATGDIEGVTVTSPITGGGTSGTVNIAIQQANGSQSGYLSSTDWTTFNSKYTPSGTAGYVPFFATSSSLTNQHDLITLNTANAFKLGIGFTSGGNSQLDNYFTSSAASGLTILDNASVGTKIAGLGLATSSIKWNIFNSDANNDLSFHSNAGSWVEKMRLTDAGELILPLANSTNSKLLYIDANGTLVALPHGTTNQVLTQINSTTYGWATPSTSGVTNLAGVYNISTNASTGAITITDSQSNAGTMWNPGAQTFTISSTTPTLVNFTNSSSNNGVSANATTDAVIVPNTGRYKITYSATVRSDLVTGSTPPDNSFGIHINGTLSSNGTIVEQGSTSGEYVSVSKSIILNLTANDSITLRHYSLNGNTYNTQILYAHMTVQRVW